jgi:hypothetical protein
MLLFKYLITKNPIECGIVLQFVKRVYFIELPNVWIDVIKLIINTIKQLFLLLGINLTMFDHLIYFMLLMQQNVILQSSFLDRLHTLSKVLLNDIGDKQLELMNNFLRLINYLFDQMSLF